MPELPEHTSLQYATEPCTSKTLADEAQRDALSVYEKLTSLFLYEPVRFLEHTESSRMLSNAYLERIGQEQETELSKFLKVHPHDIRKRFRGSDLGVCNRLGQVRFQKCKRSYFVYSIVALGDLAYTNGLPKLGQEQKEFELKSGQALHFRGDLDQYWGGHGGGVLLWIYWNALQD